MNKVTKYTCMITTVDPSSSTVRFVIKGDAQERSALIATVPVAFRWPQVGEAWMVRQENGTWYLDGPQSTSAYQDAGSGDAIINASSGVVHIMGSPDGSTDFSFSMGSPIYFTPVTAPATPVTGFVLYVDQSDGHLKAKKSTGAVTVLAS